jgi:hypothetical protein
MTTQSVRKELAALRQRLIHVRDLDGAGYTLLDTAQIEATQSLIGHIPLMLELINDVLEPAVQLPPRVTHHQV